MSTRNKVLELLIIVVTMLGVASCIPVHQVTMKFSFNSQKGWLWPIECKPFLSKRENTVPVLAFRWNSALAVAANDHLKGCTLKVNVISHQTESCHTEKQCFVNVT